MTQTTFSPELCAQTQDCLSGDWHERLGQMAHWMWLHPIFAIIGIVCIIAAARMGNDYY